MILPIGASRFEEALQMGSETYHHLKVQFEFNHSVPALYLNNVYDSLIIYSSKHIEIIPFLNFI